MKKVIYYCVAAMTILLASCEKDLYEDSLTQPKQSEVNGKVSYVSINDVPFLKPTVEKFKNRAMSRTIDSLDLDLAHIKEYLSPEGFKSYSIIINKEDFEDGDFYFENLHIVQKDDKLEYFIARYNPKDDTKKADFSNYTGTIQFYDENKNLVGTVRFEDNLLKLIEQAPPSGGILGEDGTTSYGGCGCGSIMGQLFNWFGSLFLNMSSTSGNSGYVLVVTSPNMGTSNSPGNPPQGSTNGNNGHVIVAPNVAEMTNFQKASYIYQWMNPTDMTLLSWLRTNSSESNDELISYILDEGAHADKAFLLEAVKTLKTGGSVNLANEIIIDASIENNPKVKCVLQKLLNLDMGANFKKTIVDMFGSRDKSNLKFMIGNLPPVYDAVTTGNVPYIFPGNKLYTVTLNSSFVNSASPLEIAMHLLHETIHVELVERCLELGIITGITYQPNYDARILFSNGTNMSLNSNAAVLNSLIHYYNTYGGATEWNHNIMTALNYQDVIEHDLLQVYPTLNDPANDFLSNINNDPQNTNGNFTLPQAMHYLSWTGLEGTQAYQTNVANIPAELNKKNYISIASRTKFTQNCQ